MKTIIYFGITVLLIPFTVLANKGSIYLNASSKLTRDTSQLQTITNTVESTHWYDKGYMPWVTAAFVGVITIISTLVSVRLQIISSSKLATRQHKATLSSKNRQEWINELRNEINLLVSNCKILIVHLTIKNRDSNQTDMLNLDITLNWNKLRLLLDPVKTDHNALLVEIDKMIDYLDKEILAAKSQHHIINAAPYYEISEKIITTGRKLLYTEWGKIQDSR